MRISCCIHLQGQDGIKFADALCQMVDLIKPVNPSAITLEDLINSKPMSGNARTHLLPFNRVVNLKCDCKLVVGVLFDVLFNFHKFLRFESRDPFQEKVKREDGYRTDWDRFANGEYVR